MQLLLDRLRERRFDAARMLRLHRLDRHDPTFVVGYRVVRRAARHKVRGAGTKIDHAAAFEFDRKKRAHDKEQLVFLRVVVAHELAAHFRDLHILIVDLREHFGRQVFGDIAECGSPTEVRRAAGAGQVRSFDIDAEPASGRGWRNAAANRSDGFGDFSLKLHANQVVNVTN
ncbi:hypothetical protein BJG93_35535 [Paraburkholderia sprentiae WSM5005]|uniref:Uncharacterized protein n=1 Tax=Paraburkholderia sprentiae WSM5005 TaxID=754502 RepID=A0A8F4QKR8_9BURK|nr:hypothetical protein BJG93_35535 [Paraburkholderia sprentiae WSM5005]